MKGVPAAPQVKEEKRRERDRRKREREIEEEREFIWSEPRTKRERVIAVFLVWLLEASCVIAPSLRSLRLFPFFLLLSSFVTKEL